VDGEWSRRHVGVAVRESILAAVRSTCMLSVGTADRERVVDVHEAKIPATTEVGIISRELLSLCENYSDEFAAGPHPVLLIEADKARSGGVNCMVPAHFYL
jgi:hypothetical protein